MAIRYAPALLLVIISLVGCENTAPVATETTETSAAVQPSNRDNLSANPGPADDAGVEVVQDSANQDAESNEDESTASKTADFAKKWLSDRFKDASDTGSQTADDVSDWATDMYKSLKKQGLTTAGNASEWLSEDIQNMNAFQYKVETYQLSELDDIESKLNKLGKDRWECFHVAQNGSQMIFFFKKGRRSFLKHVPVRDLMKLLPLLGGGEDGE